MLYAFTNRKTTNSPNIVALETSAIDLQYPKDGGNGAFKREFFNNLGTYLSQTGGTIAFEQNPRSGDAVMVMAEDFDAALIHFGKTHNLLPYNSQELSRRQQAAHVKKALFGDAQATAGGSLANTFHALVNCRINDTPLVEGHFATAIGCDASGEIFADSLGSSIHFAQGGRSTECHVFPIDNDRILITTPSKTEPTDTLITAALLKECALDKRDRIMLGGFLIFTPGFHEVYDSVLDHLGSLPVNNRPTLVLTASSQTVSANPEFQKKILRAVRLTDTVIHANTGEFRRLMDMDTMWRRPFEADFRGLRGQDLEKAKDENIDYQSAKMFANQAAINEAEIYAAHLLTETGHDLRFVVTSGARSIFVVDPMNSQAFSPHKIDPRDIVSTVGAGDNFAAGFQLGDLYGMSNEDCACLGRDFARAVLLAPTARLAAEAEKQIECEGKPYRLQGPLAHLTDDTLRRLTIPPAIASLKP